VDGNKSSGERERGREGRRLTFPTEAHSKLFKHLSLPSSLLPSLPHRSWAKMYKARGWGFRRMIDTASSVELTCRIGRMGPGGGSGLGREGGREGGREERVMDTASSVESGRQGRGQEGREGGREGRTEDFILHHPGVERDPREEGGGYKLLRHVHLAAGFDLGREGGREGMERHG